MLSKPATMLLGLIYEKPLNAYEIIKHLNYMNVKWWFNIADSTVYSTLKTLEKLQAARNQAQQKLTELLEQMRDSVQNPTLEQAAIDAAAGFGPPPFLHFGPLTCL